MYVSTARLCDMYDVTDDFFMRRKKKHELTKNVHFVQQGNTVRWDLKAIQVWWFGDIKQDKETDDIMARVLPS